MTVDSRRKLVFLARDPRSFGNTQHPNGRTGLYIVDAKDPWIPHDPQLPARARRTHGDVHQRLPLRLVDGPANNGSGVNGQPQRLQRHPPARLDGRAGVRDRRARPVAPVHVRGAGRPASEQQPHRVHAQRRRRPARHRLDVRLRRRARLLDARQARRPDDRTRSAGRRRWTRSRSRAAASIRTTRASRRASSSTTRST